MVKCQLQLTRIKLHQDGIMNPLMIAYSLHINKMLNRCCFDLDQPSKVVYVFHIHACKLIITSNNQQYQLEHGTLFSSSVLMIPQSCIILVELLLLQLLFTSQIQLLHKLTVQYGNNNFSIISQRKLCSSHFRLFLSETMVLVTARK